MTTERELLPCPFCGATPVLHEPLDTGHQPVECTNESCCMSKMWPDVVQWNRRAALAQPVRDWEAINGVCDEGQAAPAVERALPEQLRYIADKIARGGLHHECDPDNWHFDDCRACACECDLRMAADVLDRFYAAPQPAPVAERSTDGAGAREGNERGHCAESAPVRLPDKGSAAGSEAASDGCNPAPSTLSTDGGHRGLSDALRKGSGEKLSSWDRRSMSPPSTDAFEQECADIDAILGELGLDPERMRSEGGRLILSRIFEAIRAGRATVAEDATRLDWLERNISEDELRRLFPGETDDLRAAIDARGKL